MISYNLRKMLIESKDVINSELYREIVDAVIESNNINYKEDFYYCTILMYAVLCNAPLELIEELLKAGSDVNAVDFYNRSPLMVAVRDNKKEIVELLLKYGAEIELKDKGGMTAFDYVKKNLDLAMVAIIDGEKSSRFFASGKEKSVVLEEDDLLEEFTRTLQM